METKDGRDGGAALIAQTILAMTYDEVIALANSLVQMQKSAQDDGWGWDPTEVYGEYGLANMLHSWAESNID